MQLYLVAELHLRCLAQLCLWRLYLALMWWRELLGLQRE